MVVVEASTVVYATPGKELLPLAAALLQESDAQMSN